jgi:catechol 2,3-dioxygenase-like lactoylglutathione lyase family enzyme
MIERVLSERLLTTLLVSAFGLAGCQSADEKTEDALAPTGGDKTALTRPLHTVTLITADWPAIRKLYHDGLGLTVSGPIEPDADLRSTQTSLWGMLDGLGWELYLLTRPEAPGTIQLRVLVVDRETPSPRRSWDRQEPGPYGMGFPTVDVVAWDSELRSIGFERATPEIEVFDVARPDGSTYPVHESSFYGPEFLRTILISRKGGMAQVGVYDAASGRGGPVYAAQIVEDADAMIGFFTEVLDLEVRSDREWLEYAVPFRFSTIHAKGARTGHVNLVEYAAEHQRPATGIPPRPPARGMSIWTFPVTDVDEIERRARRHGTAIVAGPVQYTSPSLGQHRAMTLRAPNGFLVEVFAAAESAQR